MKNSGQLINQLRKNLSRARGLPDICTLLRSFIQEYINPDIICLHSVLPSDQISKANIGVSTLVTEVQTNSISLFGKAVDSVLFVNKGNAQKIASEDSILEMSGYSSCALIPIYIDSARSALLEVSYVANNFRWKAEIKNCLERVAEYVGIHLSRIIHQSSNHDFPQSSDDERSNLGEWIAQAPNLVTVETNDDFTISAIVGNTVQMLGLTPEQIIGKAGFWTRVLHPSDAKKLLLKTQRGKPRDLEDEFRIIHQKTGKMRALLVNARPRISADGNLEGWTGFALDVTDRYEARRELLLERSRLEALYKVSRSLQSSANASVVALRSLKVLLSATQADCGFVVMSARGLKQSEIVASSGFNFKNLENFEHSREFSEILEGNIFEKRVQILEGEEMLQNFKELFGADLSHWRIAQIALKFEDQELGALFVCTRSPKFFSSADLDLLDVAATQVALSTRQAELFIMEKEQASSLAALYRLSHELSQQLSAQDVIEHAVPIIKEELACKRIWLGVMNEQQTQLIGQSGLGPGMRDGVSDISIDLSIPHPFLDTAIRTRQSVIVPIGSYKACSDLMRMFDRLEIGPFALVPLVALGQVVGVIAVEPIAANSFFGDRKRQLLDGMASEIATIILARRFESRVADSAKMRMAALLSSGVAHNFNNLLQAIMGQASLIELESLNPEQRSKIASMIMDAASKGAKLVKQLYSFSSEATFSPDFISVRSLLLDLKDRFKVLLGTNMSLQYQITDDSLEVKGDKSMIQQVLTNLIENAKEALDGIANAVVKVSATRLRVRSGEVHADLAPGSYVSISVEDNGQGMSEEEVERCFEPFFSTKNVDPRTGLSFSGAGLGLSAAYLIVRQHEGAIVARSQKGHGSSFTVYLPVVTLKSSDSNKTNEQSDESIADKAGSA